MSTMRLERRHVHALLILAFLAGPTWGLAMWLRWRDATPGGRACGSYVTIIEGRLIDDRYGRPIVGAWVLALDRHRARDEDVAEEPQVLGVAGVVGVAEVAELVLDLKELQFERLRE